MAASYSDIFGGVLMTNGQLGVGLSGAGEQGVEDRYKIRLPRNLRAIHEHADVVSQKVLIRIAKWAHDSYLDDNAGDELGALNQYLCWMTGCVALKARVEGDDVGPITGANLNIENFWGECIYMNTDVPTPFDAIPRAQAAAFRPRLLADAARLATVVVASKLTWWSTQHHLGSALGRAAGDRNFHGFLEKVVRSIGLADVRFDTPGERTYIYNLVHPWCTQAVFYRLLKCDDIDPVPSIPTHAVVGQGNLPVQFEHTRFLKVDIQPDVELRKNAFGAGYAKLADLVAGICLVSNHPLFAFIPQSDQISAVLDAHQQVKDHPYMYGLAARFLTGSDEARIWNSSTATGLIAGVATWLAVFAESHTLRRSALFSTEPANLPNYDPIWASSCNAYRARSLKGAALDRAQVDALISAAGGLTGGQVDADVVARLQQIGSSVTAARLETYIDAVQNAQ